MTIPQAIEASGLAVFTLPLILVAACAYPLAEADDQKYVRPARATMAEVLADPLLEKVMAAIPASAVDHAEDPPGLADDAGEAVLQRLRSTSPEFAVTCRRSANRKTWAWEGKESTEGEPRSVPLRCAWFEDQSIPEWSGTLAHELAHHAGYSHEGNRRSGNECTVPHLVADALIYVATLRSTGRATLTEDACPALKTGSAAVR
ncbi:hypothetical protein [Nannocystis punicea]|uniref:Uncharacterized protein n=1 Tax=Nannocystis punicea TaxID=2995304 RepID=A0ABY7HBC0_9BACT|nr:hypothetical protein [Nannocystis poenicansa]WAS96570.1 hypothetical protein O0S08_10465 [Nannocystis poenicansa]